VGLIGCSLHVVDMVERNLVVEGILVVGDILVVEGILSNLVEHHKIPMEVQILESCKEEELIACESQVRTLSALVEDLDAQLNASREDNKALINKADVADMNLLDALGKNKTLSQTVDELTWKLNNPGVVPVSPSAVNFKEQQKNGASRPLPTTTPHQPPSRNCT